MRRESGLPWRGCRGKATTERAIVLGVGGVAHEIGIDQVSARQRAQVGAASRDDRIGIAVADDAAHRHGRDVERVADLVAEDRLIESALRAILLADHAAAGDRHNVVAGVMQHAGDL